jgi:hypothetical protein
MLAALSTADLVSSKPMRQTLSRGCAEEASLTGEEAKEGPPLDQ